MQAWKARDYESWSTACADTRRVDESDPRALMTCDELGQLARMKGIEIGGHTVRHPILARASAYDQRWEIEQNLRDIEQWTGKRPRAFAFPNGRPDVDDNADTLAILRDAGVDMAFTTRPSFARSHEQPLNDPFLLAGRYERCGLTARIQLVVGATLNPPTEADYRRHGRAHLSMSADAQGRGRPDGRRLSCSPRFGQ